MNKIKKKPITGALLGITVIAVLLACFIAIPYVIHEPEPLVFFLNNKDAVNHEVNIKIFDSKNVPIFEKSYFLNPEEQIKSREITSKAGLYKYEITLNGSITKIQKAEISQFKGSDFISIYILPDHDNPLEIDVSLP